MRTLRTVAELRAALREPRRAGRSIGLVPTMGAFHEGHLSLMRRAREECDEVVVSLFVNPTQFNEGSDLEAYPREEQHDAAQAAEIGVDLLFAPTVEEVYPDGFSTTVSVAGLTETLEGEHRGAGHFAGVATVVTKLLNMCQPDVAFFGQKDAQQALVIRRMVRDLDLPVRIEICPTVREPDGLALSSRNVRLAPADRSRAAGLSAALRTAAATAAAGERDAETILGAARAVLSDFELEPEYLALTSADSLAPLTTLDGPALVAVAARVGGVRLIDNVLIDPAPVAGPGVTTSATGRQIR